MLIVLISLLFLAPAAKCHDASNETQTLAAEGRIIGGRYVDINQAPYIVQILEGDSQFCGGSIISKWWILSAAHCFTDARFSILSVLTGSSTLEGGEQHKIERIITHERYDDETSDNDIALIKLANPITFKKNQKPIAIATTFPKIGDRLFVTGFGKTEDGDESEILKAAVVSVVGHNLCKRRYATERVSITGNMFCASKQDTDTCQGDSGGPAVINGKLSGIVSFGMECASRFFPGVYTQVYSFRKWIVSKTGLEI